MENFSQKRSRKLLFVIGGAVLSLIVVGAAVIMAIGGGDTQQPASLEQSGNAQGVASKEEVEQGLKDIESSLKQSKDNQNGAKEALEDDKKQIKVGS